MSSRHSPKKHPQAPEPAGHVLHGPYWLRAHRDWRFWAVVMLMLAAMWTYTTTNNLSWWPGFGYR